MRIIKCASFIFMGLMLSGFSPIIVRSATESDDAKAKLFESDPTRALVYVFRDNSFLGQDAASQLVVNKVAVTKNSRNQFSVVSLSPGNYEFFSVSSHESNAVAAVIHNKRKPPIQLAVEPGRLYFFQEVFKSMSGFSLKLVSEEEAKIKIKKGKLAAIHNL